LRVEILRPPSIANFNDVQPLENEDWVELRWRKPGESSEGWQPDLVVIPGTKFTLSDMELLNRSGESRRLKQMSSRGTWMLGVCGGLQMLGREIEDGPGIDGKKGLRVPGLGLLDLYTDMHPLKISEAMQARAETPFGSFDLKGFEMHHGRSRLGSEAREYLRKPMALRPLMTGGPSGKVWASYLHGLFDNDKFREKFLSAVAKSRGRRYRASARIYQDRREAQLKRWANHVERHIDLRMIPGFPKRLSS
jgi:adenosylcobyric acid synthase